MEDALDEVKAVPPPSMARLIEVRARRSTLTRPLHHLDGASDGAAGSAATALQSPVNGARAKSAAPTAHM
jgi:hypothetical protein